MRRIFFRIIFPMNRSIHYRRFSRPAPDWPISFLIAIHLMFRALRCNTTLTGGLYFKGVPLSDDSHPKLIKDHIKLNNWWQSFKSEYNIGINKNKKKKTTTTTTNIGTGTIAPKNAVQGQPNAQPKTLAMSLYPYLIMKKLCVKPQFLYEFLQSETPTLVGATTTAAAAGGQHHP